VERSQDSARLFFALWPTAAMQEALAVAVSEIVRASDGRPVPAKNFHLTLAFLGAVPRSRFEAIFHVAAQCAQACDARDLPLTLTLDTIELFRKSQVLCATPSHPHRAVAQLARVLTDTLVAEGFMPDPKALPPGAPSTPQPFRPHVTLVRKATKPRRPSPLKPFTWSFNDFALIESRPSPEGSTYRPLHVHPLG
jgi:2'-5' RNA ligase